MRRIELILVGGGEHGRTVADAVATASTFGTLIGYVDSQRSETLEDIQGIRWLGGDEVISDHPNALLVLGVGAIKAADGKRRHIVARLSPRRWATVVHQSAVISPYARLSEGAVVMAGAIVQSGAKLDAHCLIGSGAIIEHDVMIDEFSIVGPGAVVGGGASIGADAFVGLGARVRDHRHVGAGAMVGMGAVVVSDVSPGVEVVGIPATTRARMR